MWKLTHGTHWRDTASYETTQIPAFRLAGRLHMAIGDRGEDSREGFEPVPKIAIGLRLLINHRNRSQSEIYVTISY